LSVGERLKVKYFVVYHYCFNRKSVGFQLMIRDGLVIPHHLDTPHGVSFILTQKRGQLNVKQMQKGN